MILLFDIQNAFHKSYFVYKSMYKDDKINEKLLFNKFMLDFGSTCRLFSEKNKIDQIICCYDSDTNFRNNYSVDYKSNREKKDDSFYNVLNYSKKYLEGQGFIVTCINGLEADDSIGLWANKFKDKSKVILSADEDIRQLLDRNTFVYNNQSSSRRFYFYEENNFKLVTKENGEATLMTSFNEIDAFVWNLGSLSFKLFQENPNLILFKKMILGCEGDNVPKLLKGRVGEATLKKKLFDKIKFDKNNISDTVLGNISISLYEVFGEKIFINELNKNLALVNLCSDVYHSDTIKEDFEINVKKSKFTYNGNYQFI